VLKVQHKVLKEVLVEWVLRVIQGHRVRHKELKGQQVHKERKEE
jgi:hypothetical protein